MPFSDIMGVSSVTLTNPAGQVLPSRKPHRKGFQRVELTHSNCSIALVVMLKSLCQSAGVAWVDVNSIMDVRTSSLLMFWISAAFSTLMPAYASCNPMMQDSSATLPQTLRKTFLVSPSPAARS